MMKTSKVVVVALAVLFGMCLALLNEAIDTTSDLVEIQGQVVSTELASERRLADLNQKYDMLFEAYKVQDAVVSKEREILKYSGSFVTSAYCLSGTTASGYKVMEDITVAADPKVFPIGTKLYIEDVGIRIVHDTGGDIKGKRLDIYFKSYDKCIEWGRRPKKVWIVQ